MIEGEFGAFVPRDETQVEVDAVFAPLVAFDAYGTRLGYGGGFYDRTLAKLRMQNPDTPYIGLAFEAQRAEAPLPSEKTDIALDGVITELGYRAF